MEGPATDARDGWQAAAGGIKGPSGREISADQIGRVKSVMHGREWGWTARQAYACLTECGWSPDDAEFIARLAAILNDPAGSP